MPAPELAAPVAEALGTGPDRLDGPRVLVARTPAQAARIVDGWPEAAGFDVVLHDGDLADLHVAMAVLDRPALVVDGCRGDGGLRRCQRLVPHLRAGGTYVALTATGRPQQVAALGAFVDAVTDLHARGAVVPPDVRGDARPRTERDLHAFAATVDRAEVGDGVLVVRTGRDDVLARLAEADVGPFLDLAPHRGRVLSTLPAGSYAARGSFTSSADDVRVDVVEHPALTTATFADVVCHDRRVAHQDRVLLPASFPDPHPRRGRTAAVHDWGAGFATLDVAGGEPRDLPGRWLHLDNLHRGHFGHAFLEQVGQLWAWRGLLERDGADGVLLLRGETVRPWEQALLDAAGVPPDRVHAAHGPVRVEHLITSTPAYVIDTYAHPLLLDLYRDVGARLRASSGSAPGPDRVFVTRRGGKRPCRNVDEVEALFAEHGFAVVEPQHLTLPDQAALFGRAAVVAGFAGSGLFPFVCSPAVREVVAISTDTYHAANEQQLAALAGVDLTLTRSVSEVQSEAFSLDAFHSGFTVDWGFEGAFLRERLRELGKDGA